MKLDANSDLPVILPSDIDFTALSKDSVLSTWVKDNASHVQDLLSKHGGLIFRHFDVRNADDFQSVCQYLPGEFLNHYKGGAVKRKSLTSSVFNSTELTKYYRLSIHHEMAYQSHYPDYISFFCEKRAKRGGQTLLADSRAIARDLPSDVVSELEERGLMYVRTFQDRRILREVAKKLNPLYVHLTWQESFKTEDKSQVEAWCKKQDIEYEWRDNGDLALITRLPAFVKHPLSGEMTFCNQLSSQHHNSRTFGKIVYRFRNYKYANKSSLPNQAYYGDGGDVSQRVINSVLDATDKNTKFINWKNGDVLILDNRIVGHGRRPYRGKRSVRVVMKRAC